MTVETLIEFLQTLPTDTKVVTYYNDNVDLQYIQTISKDGKIEKRLIVQ